MTKIYTVTVENRFDDNYLMTKYFTTKEKALKYAEKLNAEYETARAEERYGAMIYYVDMGYGIKEVIADEEEE